MKTGYAEEGGVFRHGLYDSKVLGVVIGIVTKNDGDPENLGRVKLQLPTLTGDEETGWVRVASFMAGADRGAIFLPEVDDEVLVAFQHGDVNLPIVVGALHNGKDSPPYANEDGDNDIRVIQSRSGSILRFDDKSGSEKIEISNKDEDHRIVIDIGENKITIESAGELEIKASDKLTLEGQEVEIISKGDMTLESSGSFDAESSSAMTLKSDAKIDLNP